jgi:transcriptional regulator with XRE-family HTH domain
LGDLQDLAESAYYVRMTITQSQQQPIDDAFIGRRVHQLMWDAHMTQTDLGNALGMDQSTVAKRLRGKVGWPAALLVRIAPVLNTTVAYLVGESAAAHPTGPNGPTLDYGSDGSAVVTDLLSFRKLKTA